MQISCSGTKGEIVCEDDSFYENFNMDEVDLGIENYDELFRVALDSPEKLFENDDIDGLFGMEISGADSNCQDAHIMEVLYLHHMLMFSSGVVVAFSLLYFYSYQINNIYTILYCILSQI